MIKITNLIKHYIAKYQQIVKFVIVGLLNTLISLIIYYGLLFLNVNYQIANISSFIISSLNGYFWSSKWVFKSKRSGFSFIKFYSSYGTTFVLSVGIVFFTVEILHISPLYAPIISLIFTIPANFLLNKYWTFREKTS